MSDHQESLLDCDKPELQEPREQEGLKRPGAIIAVVTVVIALLALVATCGPF